MKKLFYLFILITFAYSCSQDDAMISDNSKEINSDKSNDLVLTSEDGTLSNEFLLKLQKDYPEKFVFGEDHSDLWPNGNGLRASSEPYIVSGFDTKELIKTTVSMFPLGSSCDLRIAPGIYYIENFYHYIKYIQVPKGATVILPPESVMATFQPMGIIPGTLNKYGYTYAFVWGNNTHDTYALITQIFEITHTSLGQQMAPLDNPVYGPCKAYYPINMVFKYTYSDVVW